MSKQRPLVALKLAVQAALIGEVTNRIASVTCGLKNRHIQIRAYVSGEIQDADIERVQFISTEVIANFPEGYTIEASRDSVGHEKEEMLDFWAFRRAAE
jgi:hypothetical protein